MKPRFIGKADYVAKLDHEKAEPRWAIWSRMDIPDLLHREETYLSRLRIIQTPLFGFYSHTIYLDDGDRNLHDHPWNFVSVILKGGYVEEVRDSIDGPTRTKHRRRFNRVRRGQCHAVRSLDRAPTWTLVFVGRKLGDWGFVEDGLDGPVWVAHRPYLRRFWSEVQ